MRREAMYLGHPRIAFPLQNKILVQSIGSGAKFEMQTESMRGWDLTVQIKPEKRPGYNPLSLLEVWIEDVARGRKIYGFAKFVESLSPTTMLLRIIEIEGQHREHLQELMLANKDQQQEDAA